MHGLFHRKTKKLLQLLERFKRFLNDFGCKLNKIWADQGSEFYMEIKVA